jgi:hypothetical protein
LSRHRRVFRTAIVILTVAVAGCERMPGSAKITETMRLTCDPARLSLTAGGSGTLAASAIDAAGKAIDGAVLHFEASDSRLLRVNALGEAKSVGPAGHTSILITSGSRSLTVPVDIVAGPAHRFAEVEGADSAIVAGTPSKASVRLMDAFDNPIANSRVMLEAAIERPIALSTATDTNGIATVTLPVITEAGRFILNVHTAEAPQVSLPLEMRVEAAEPTRLEAIKVLDSGPVALVADFELVLRVRDDFGNPVPDVWVRWQTDSGSKSFNPQQSLSGQDGLVRTRWELAGLNRRRASLRAFVVKKETIRFETWVALER